jgi:hypothetical protein
MKRPSSLSERFYLILNVVMVLMYACGGIILYFWQLPSIPTYNRKILSGVLILYSIYRGAVLYNKSKKIG